MTLSFFYWFYFSNSWKSWMMLKIRFLSYVMSVLNIHLKLIFHFRPNVYPEKRFWSQKCFYDRQLQYLKFICPILLLVRCWQTIYSSPVVCPLTVISVTAFVYCESGTKTKILFLESKECLIVRITRYLGNTQFKNCFIKYLTHNSMLDCSFHRVFAAYVSYKDMNAPVKII